MNNNQECRETSIENTALRRGCSWLAVVVLFGCSAAPPPSPLCPTAQAPAMPIAKAIVADSWPRSSAPAWEDPWTVVRTPQSDTYSVPPRKPIKHSSLY